MSSAPRRARRVVGPALGVLDDWRQLAQPCRTNLLIVGELAAKDREDVLRTIQARCGLDGFHTQGPQGLLLPPRSDVIVILDDACRLSEDEQQRLLWWVRQHHAQVTSFASTSLYDMVRAGRFMDALYYQLNTICVVLTSGAKLANPRSVNR
jgi:hypothetical protein